jgi:hypothetical protein
LSANSDPLAFNGTRHYNETPRNGTDGNEAMKIRSISSRRLNWKSVGTTAVIALLALFPTSCKKKPNVAAANTQAGTQIAQIAASSGAPAALHVPNGDNVSLDGSKSYAHISYLPSVKTFEDSEVRSSLMGITSDGHGFLFQNASQNIKDLKADDVFMVKGEMAAKVLGVVNDSDKTLVLVDQASLADLVQDGNINIDTPVRFTGPRNIAKVNAQPSIENLLDLVDSPVYAQSGLKGSTADVARQQGTQDAAVNAAKAIGSAITSGWTVSQYSFTPGDAQCNFQIVLVKSSQGFVARIAAKGWIGNFDFAANMQNIAANKGRGAASHMFSSVKNMKGNIQFDWEIGKESPGVWAVEDRVKLPGGLSVPLAPLLGGLPLTLDISAALLIHPALTGGSEYSRGGFSISWGGPGGGFETTSAGAVNNGDSGGSINLTYQVTTDQNISPVAPNAMVISYCAPRIELRLDVLGPFASSLSSFGSAIDKIASTMEKVLPQSVLDAIAKSPLSKVTASNILASNADVYVQFIATEGVTHSSSMTPAPCSKQEIKFDADGGVSAQFFGLTDSAKKTTNFFTKTFTRWDPASDFCKSV